MVSSTTLHPPTPSQPHTACIYYTVVYFGKGGGVGEVNQREGSQSLVDKAFQISIHRVKQRPPSISLTKHFTIMLQYFDLLDLDADLDSEELIPETMDEGTLPIPKCVSFLVIFVWSGAAIL